MSHGDELRQRLEALRCQLRNFADTAPIREYVREKERMRQKLREARQKESAWADLVQLREKAQVPRSLEHALVARRLVQRKERLKELQALNAPAAILSNEEGMIWEYEVPLPEILRVRQEARAETLACEQALCRADEAYRAAKEQLRREMRQVEEALAAQQGQAGTPLASATACSLSKRGPHRPHQRRRNAGTVDDQPARISPQNGESAADVWQLIYVDDAGSREYPLARRSGKLLSVLDQLIRQTGHHLSASRVLAGLKRVIKLSAAGRARLPSPVTAELREWHVIRLGRKYRALLDINEQARMIRFVVRDRRDAYRTAPRPS